MNHRQYRESVWNLRQQRALLCCLLSLSGLALQVPAETILIDDFSDANDDGWITVDSTAGQTYGPGSFSASMNEYRLEGAGIIHDDVPGGGFLFSTWDASADGKFSNGFLRATARAETEGSIASLAL